MQILEILNLSAPVVSIIALLLSLRTLRRAQKVAIKSQSQLERIFGSFVREQEENTRKSDDVQTGILIRPYFEGEIEDGEDEVSATRPLDENRSVWYGERVLRRPLSSDDTRRRFESAWWRGDEAEGLESAAQDFVDLGIWAPGSLYISGDDPVAIKTSLRDLLRLYGIEVAAEGPEVLGSWFQKMWVKAARGAGNSEGLKERLRKVEQAVQLHHLGKPQAEIDKEKAEAVATLLNAVAGQDKAFLRIGTLIVVKSEDRVAVWTISEMQAAELEKAGDLMNDPERVISMLNLPSHVHDRSAHVNNPTPQALASVEEELHEESE